MNYFEVFELPRRLAIDERELQRRFYELSRRYHPDFHQSATPEAQAEALSMSALVNAAYRALRDPIARIEYLVRLEEGRDTKEGAAARPQAPPALLAEMFEIQEALQEAKSGGFDEATRARLAEEHAGLAERYAAEEARLTGPLSAAWDAASADARPGALAALKAGLAARSYLRTVIDDLGEVLGAGSESPGEGSGRDVAHHRH